MVKKVIPTKVPMGEQPANERIHNYQEVPYGYTPEQAMEEAIRCLQCAKPTCMDGCPVNVNIPGFLGLVADGDFQGAVDMIKQTNALPGHHRARLSAGGPMRRCLRIAQET